MYLSRGSGSTGKIVLGGYDLDSYAKEGTLENDIQWVQLADDSWTISMDGLKFKDSDKSIPIKGTQLMLDSGLSYSMVPQEDITIIEGALAEKGVKCEENHNGGLDLYECACPDDVYKNL